MCQGAGWWQFPEDQEFLGQQCDRGSRSRGQIEDPALGPRGNSTGTDWFVCERVSDLERAALNGSGGNSCTARSNRSEVRLERDLDGERATSRNASVRGRHLWVSAIWTALN